MQVTPDVGPKPCTDISGKELPEPVTRSIKVTLPTPAISLYDHSFNHSSHTSKHRICDCCITMLRVASRSGSRHIRYERQPTEVRRPAHEGLEAASLQTEPGEKM